MFLYRELLIALLISLASIVLADIIVQPGYTHQYGNYPQHQIVPQTKSPTEQYRSKAYNAHTYPSYKPYETNAKYFIGYPRHHYPHYPHYPHYHHRPYYPSNPHRLHFAKIGGRGYEKPSVYLGYPKPFIVHSRRKRSFESNPANIESSKIKITEKDNDVAAKSPVIDIKNLAVDDSLLPENEPTDTNDKRVVKRQVGVNNPFLSDGITTAYYHPVILNTMKDILQTRHPGIHFVPVREKTPEQEETPTNGYRIISNEPTILHSMSETDDDSQYRDALNTEKKISTEEFTSAIENVNLHLPSGVYRVWNPKGEDSQLNEPSYPEYRSLDARMYGMAPSTRTEQVWRSNYNSNYRDAEDAEDVEDVEDAINQKPTAEQILSLMALIRTLWPKTHPFFVNTEEQVKAFQTRAAHQEMYPSQVRILTLIYFVFLHFFFFI
ncbi:hypothetical protein PUN28_002522 [Cardiocondyla obscurior]|uniref:Uncharacterized protein n=1 Tax=Cardiocondyla obscurior TaxID=286306 RepID=A0AAW2GUL2_9HYME